MSEDESPPPGTDAKPHHFTPDAQLSADGRPTRVPEAKESAKGQPYTRARCHRGHDETHR